MDTVTDVLNRIMNAKMAGKISCETQASNFLIKVLDVMKKNGYIDYEVSGEEKTRKAIIKFKSLNKCRIISPRFYAKKDEITKYVRRFLPSRNLGILIISTNKGLMTHIEAEENKVGGVLIAYCY